MGGTSIIKQLLKPENKAALPYVEALMQPSTHLDEDRQLFELCAKHPNEFVAAAREMAGSSLFSRNAEAKNFVKIMHDDPNKRNAFIEKVTLQPLGASLPSAFEQLSKDNKPPTLQPQSATINKPKSFAEREDEKRNLAKNNSQDVAQGK